MEAEARRRPLGTRPSSVTTGTGPRTGASRSTRSSRNHREPVSLGSAAIARGAPYPGFVALAIGAVFR